MNPMTQPSSLQAGTVAAGFSAQSLPVLASTQFCMEILLRGPVLDLGSIVEVLRFDPCAVLRLFAEAAKDGDGPETASPSLSNCIVALGVAGLHRALTYAPSTWQQQGRLAAWAQHGATLAQGAAELAGAVGIAAEMAYVVGLLHDLEGLPAALGVPLEAGHLSAPSLRTSALLAEACCLPSELTEALASLHGTTEGDQFWPSLIRAAHELAEAGQAEMRTNVPSTGQSS